MNEKRPLGIQLISGFYIFGGLVLLFTAFFTNLGTEVYDIAYRLGMPWLPEFYCRIGLAVLSFIMAYGLLKLRKWGFWLFTIYNIYFFMVSWILYAKNHEHLFSGNLSWSILMLVYLIIKRKEFIRPKVTGG